MQTRFHVLALALALLACPPKPQPVVTNGPGTHDAAVTPRGWPDSARTTISTLTWLLPAIDQLMAADAQMPAEAKAAVHRAVVGLTAEALPGFTRAVDAFVARGGVRCREAQAECCVAYAQAGLVREGLVALARAVVRSGFSLGVDLEHVFDAVGGILDGFTGFCAPEAGFLRIGEDTATLLRSMQDTARQGGASLRAMPPLQP